MTESRAFVVNVLKGFELSDEFWPLFAQSNQLRADDFMSPCTNGPFTLSIFAAISSAILRRFQNARVNYWRRFRGDLNRQ